MNDSLSILDETRGELDAEELLDSQEYTEDITEILRILQRNWQETAAGFKVVSIDTYWFLLGVIVLLRNPLSSGDSIRHEGDRDIRGLHGNPI